MAFRIHLGNKPKGSQQCSSRPMAKGKSQASNIPVLVHRLALLSARETRGFCPHLLDVLQHHVAVAVKGLDARKKLPVVANRDEDLGMAADCRLKDRQRTGRKLVLFQLANFVFSAMMLAPRQESDRTRNYAYVNSFLGLARSSCTVLIVELAICPVKLVAPLIVASDRQPVGKDILLGSAIL